MPCILLQSLCKSPQFTNHFYSMYPKGNTQLHIRKWWVPLISALYLSFFVIILSIPINNHHQVSKREINQGDSSLLQNNNSSSINSTNTKFQTKNNIKSVSCALQR